MWEWLSNNVWSVWLVLGAGLAVTELVTLDFTLLMLAAGAVAGGATALIFPGILTSGGDTMLPGIAGGLAALLIALFKPSVPLVVAGAVAAAMLTSIFF